MSHFEITLTRLSQFVLVIRRNEEYGCSTNHCKLSTQLEKLYLGVFICPNFERYVGEFVILP